MLRYNIVCFVYRSPLPYHRPCLISPRAFICPLFNTLMLCCLLKFILQAFSQRVLVFLIPSDLQVWHSIVCIHTRCFTERYVEVT